MSMSEVLVEFHSSYEQEVFRASFNAGVLVSVQYEYDQVGEI